MGRPHAWFQVIGPRGRNGGYSPATALVHAKRFGTNASACGVLTTNLEKNWDLAFDPYDVAACDACCVMVRDAKTPPLVEVGAR
jgi:hypothetical protein